MRIVLNCCSSLSFFYNLNTFVLLMGVQHDPGVFVRQFVEVGQTDGGLNPTPDSSNTGIGHRCK